MFVFERKDNNSMNNPSKRVIALAIAAKLGCNVGYLETTHVEFCDYDRVVFGDHHYSLTIWLEKVLVEGTMVPLKWVWKEDGDLPVLVDVHYDYITGTVSVSINESQEVPDGAYQGRLTDTVYEGGESYTEWNVWRGVPRELPREEWQEYLESVL